MVRISESFEFWQSTIVLKSTGLKAHNLREMRELISTVSDNCIYHHTFQYFIKGNILEYTNDFAQWVYEALGEQELSERLSSIDPYTFSGISEIRTAIIGVIDDFLSTFPAPREAIRGEELFFNEAVTIIFPLGIRAKNLAEFLIAVKYIDPGSIYYHFYEARNRLGGIDDFSMWFEYALQMDGLAGRIRNVDPFMHDIEDIRRHIAKEVELTVKEKMEVAG